MKFYIFALSLIITSCVNPGIVELSPDTYVIFREDHAGIFGSGAKLRANVIKDANDFAQSKGKVAIPISSSFKPLGNGVAQWASFEYQFRVVDESDAEAVRTSLKARPDIVVEKTIDVNKETTIKNESPDKYSELIKLNDLKEKGIITEEEFQKMKGDVIAK